MYSQIPTRKDLFITLSIVYIQIYTYLPEFLNIQIKIFCIFKLNTYLPEFLNILHSYVEANPV